MRKLSWSLEQTFGECLSHMGCFDDVLSLKTFVKETRNRTDRNVGGYKRLTGILAEIESNLLRTYQQLGFAALKTESSAQLGFLSGEAKKKTKELLEQGIPFDLYPLYVQTLANLEGIKARERFSTRVTRLRYIMGNPPNSGNMPSYLDQKMRELFVSSGPQRKADLYSNYPEIAATL